MEENRNDLERKVKDGKKSDAYRKRKEVLERLDRKISIRYEETESRHEEEVSVG